MTINLLVCGILYNNCPLQLSTVICFIATTRVSKITHSEASNNICSKAVTIYWIRNERICYQYLTAEEVGGS